MQERFPGAVQRGCDGFHYAGMIRFCRIDYGVGFARGARNDFRVVERTEYRTHAAFADLLHALLRSNQAGNRMTLAQKTFGY